MKVRWSTYKTNDKKQKINPRVINRDVSGPCQNILSASINMSKIEHVRVTHRCSMGGGDKTTFQGITDYCRHVDGGKIRTGR
jgi:hypothetical protein